MAIAIRELTEQAALQLTGGELVCDFMRHVGADVIFGIPGGASLPLNDALTAAHLAGQLRYVLTGHEQGAAFEATGYAAASGKVGFCTGTSGPGATNLITGLADAYRDSRPVLAVTGNTATFAEPEAFQAIDIVGITNGRATKLSLRPERAEDVQAALVRAYHAATTGRPGAVLVDLPRDVQVGRAAPRPWAELFANLDWSPPTGDEAALAEAARLLATAERPLLYAGHGVVLADASRELRELSHLLGAPVATTVHGIGLLPADDRLNLGMLGMHGAPVANLAPYLADVVVALGARFDDRVVGGKPQQFAPNAVVVHVDIDLYQLNRIRKVDLAVHADVGHALRGLLLHTLAAKQPDRSAWLARLDELKNALPIQSYDEPASDELSHESVYEEAARALREAEVDDLVATFDVGTHQMKGAQWFPVSKPRSFLTSGGMGSMGCALSLAVGAAIARPGATVLAAVGDGGFVMSSHELDTIGGYGVPVKILLFDDAALGMVTNWHGLFFGGRNLTSDRRRGKNVAPATRDTALADNLKNAPDTTAAHNALVVAAARLASAEGHQYAFAAAAYGIPAERVETKVHFKQALQRALQTDGPYLIHICLPRQNQVYPLMQPGTTPQDLMWRESEPGSGAPVYLREVFDYGTGRLIPT